MKLQQFKGPFTKNSTITTNASSNYTYVHIGIQIPYTQPICISGKDEMQRTTPDIMINNMSYRINNTGILEFDKLAENNISIKILKDTSPEAIIDLIYKN